MAPSFQPIPVCAHWPDVALPAPFTTSRSRVATTSVGRRLPIRHPTPFRCQQLKIGSKGRPGGRRVACRRRADRSKAAFGRRVAATIGTAGRVRRAVALRGYQTTPLPRLRLASTGRGTLQLFHWTSRRECSLMQVRWYPLSDVIARENSAPWDLD